MKESLIHLAHLVCSICTPYKDPTPQIEMMQHTIAELRQEVGILKESYNKMLQQLITNAPINNPSCQSYFLQKISNMIRELGNEYMGQPLTDDKVAISLANLKCFYREPQERTFKLQSNTLSESEFLELDNNITQLFAMLRNPEHANLIRLVKSVIKFSMAELPLTEFIIQLDQFMLEMLLNPDLYPTFPLLIYSKHAQFVKNYISTKYRDLGSFILHTQDSKLTLLADRFEELNNGNLQDLKHSLNKQFKKTSLLAEELESAIRLATQFNKLLYKDMKQQLAGFLAQKSSDGSCKQYPLNISAKEALLDLLALEIMSLDKAGMTAWWPGILPYRLKFELAKICPELLDEHNAVDLIVPRQLYPWDITDIYLEITQIISCNYFRFEAQLNHQILQAYQNNNILFVAVTRELATFRSSPLVDNIYDLSHKLTINDLSHKLTIRDLCEMTQEILTLIFRNRLIDDRYRIDNLRISLNSMVIDKLLRCGEQLLLAVQDQNQDLFDLFKEGLGDLMHEETARNIVQGFTL